MRNLLAGQWYLKSHKDMKSPKETVLSEKREVLELWEEVEPTKEIEQAESKEENLENIVSKKPT